MSSKELDTIKKLKKIGTLWLPNYETYENTNDRLVLSIVRHTPNGSRVLVFAHTLMHENRIERSKKRIDTSTRSIYICQTTVDAIKGMDFDSYDYIIFADPHRCDKQFLMFVLMYTKSAQIFYRQVISPLQGEVCVNISTSVQLQQFFSTKI